MWKAPEWGRQHVARGVSPWGENRQTNPALVTAAPRPQSGRSPGLGSGRRGRVAVGSGPGADAPGYVLSPPFGGSNRFPHGFLLESGSVATLSIQNPKSDMVQAAGYSQAWLGSLVSPFAPRKATFI